MSEPIKKPIETSPESYKPETPKMMNMLEELNKGLDIFENNNSAFPERLVLETVAQPEYLYTLPQQLSCIIAYIEENLEQRKANIDLMNVMGIPYTYICEREKIFDYPNEDMWRINELSKALDRSMRYYGRDYIFIEANEAPEHYEEIKKAIVASINNGIPVLAGNVCGIHDFAAITGYDKRGELLTGWAANMHHAKERLDNGMFIKEYSFITYGGENHTRFLFIKGKNGSSLSDKEIIENAIETMNLTETKNKEFIPPFKAGFAALSAFKDDLDKQDTAFFETDEYVTNLMFDNIFYPRTSIKNFMAELGKKYVGNIKITDLTSDIQAICTKTTIKRDDIYKIKGDKELPLEVKRKKISEFIQQHIDDSIILRKRLVELNNVLP
jgi:hypothetical protein